MMTKFVKRKISVIAILLLTFILTGCSSGFVPQNQENTSLPPVPSSKTPANGLVQSNTGGSVTIDIEWLAERNDSLEFEVSMNTHSVDLDRYDLSKLAVLRDDIGNEYRPLSWNSAPGGHHREGTLTFPLPDSVSQGKAKYVEIVIRDVAGIKERVLKWQL